jgi:hypothetical protein
METEKTLALLAEVARYQCEQLVSVMDTKTLKCTVSVGLYGAGRESQVDGNSVVT